MARTAREVSSTGLYAITVRTNEAVFEDEEIREYFSECCERFIGEGVKGLRFLSDKAEMLIYETERGISGDMKSVMTSFSRGCNRLLQTTGKVFADRFKSVPVEDAELEEECEAYLEGRGEVPRPFVSARTAAAKKAKPQNASPVKKTAVKKETAPSKKEETPEKPAAEEKPVTQKQPEVKKKRNDMPTWLL